MPLFKPFAIVPAAMAVSLTGVALAAVAGHGSPGSSGPSARPVELKTVRATTSAQLYPGATGPLAIVIANPASFPMRLTDVLGAGTIDSSATAACDASTGVTFTNRTGLDLIVPAGSTGTAFTLPGAVRMTNASHDDCQGAVFTVPILVKGVSAAA